MKYRIRHAILVACLSGVPTVPFAQTLARVAETDAKLDCAGIAAEQKSMDALVDAGDPNAPGVGKAVAGSAANVGGQVAGATAAQASGLFGGLGGLVGKVVGVVAQQQVEENLAPDAAAQQLAVEARERRSFLGKLFSAKDCRADDLANAGNTLGADEFRKLAEGPAAGSVKPFNTSEVQAASAETALPLDSQGFLEGELKTAGKHLYISEFRVLFEVGGQVSANTRAGYMPGTNYGGTRSKIKYQVANVDVSALQALTDKAWADLQARLAADGIRLEDAAAFTSANGAVYEATEPASTAAAPVYIEQDLGHTVRKYLVLAPTGMKLHARGFAGMGAGDMGKRIEWSKAGLDGIAIGVAVNIASLETSGSGSSILHRDGANTGAGEQMMVTAPPGGTVASGHVDAGSVRAPKGLVVPGTFARFRDVGGYDTQKDAAVRALQVVGNLAGVAANKSKTVEMEVDLDGPTTSRMTLTALVTFNKAISHQLQTGQQAKGG